MEEEETFVYEVEGFGYPSDGLLSYDRARVEMTNPGCRCGECLDYITFRTRSPYLPTRYRWEAEGFTIVTEPRLEE